MSPLRQHIAVVIAVKLVLIVVLWWAFVRDQTLVPDAGRVEQQLLAPSPHTEHP